MRPHLLLKRPRPATGCDPGGAATGSVPGRRHLGPPTPLARPAWKFKRWARDPLPASLAVEQSIRHPVFCKRGTQPPTHVAVVGRKSLSTQRGQAHSERSVNASCAIYQRGGQGRRTHASLSPVGSGSWSPFRPLKPWPHWVDGDAILVQPLFARIGR